MRRSLTALATLAFTFGCLGTAEAQDFGKALKGSVVFGGKEAPKREKLIVNKDQPVCLMKGDLLSQEWLVNEKNLGLKNVFIWLEPEKTGEDLPIHPSLKDVKKLKDLEIDQPCCLFEPNCLVVREGQTVVVKNPSTIQHNFRWTGHPAKNPGGNVNMIPDSSFKITDLKADHFPVIVKCDIHGWMGGVIRVFDHPYYALTDADGKFNIPHPPAGKYRLKVWHPGSGWLGGAKGKAGTPITIEADQVADAGKMTIEMN